MAIGTLPLQSRTASRARATTEPLLVKALLTATGNSWTIGVYIAVASLVSLAAVSFVNETKGTDLHV